ncbi:MAG TPA: hypothetical protein VGO26_09860 [Amnibacterium sp.]|jgi:hypothetical protein|nr:hypothetical protein [Amnibacterium sp.]
MPDPNAPGPDALFGAGFAVIATIVVLFFVGAIALSVYRAARLAKQGVNPLTLETDLAAKALQSDALRHTPSKAERLAELDVLAANGTISAAERDEARSRILAE